MIDGRAYNGANAGSEHGSDHAMVRARQRLHIRAARLSNRRAKLHTANLKTLALKSLRLKLRSRFEALELDVDASSKIEWQQLRSAIVEAFQIHLRRTWRRL